MEDRELTGTEEVDDQVDREREDNKIERQGRKIMMIDEEGRYKDLSRKNKSWERRPG